MNKYLGSFLFVVFLQITTAQLIEDLVRQYKPAVIKREKDLGLIIRQDVNSILQVNEILEENISETILNITTRVAYIEDLLNASIIRAERADRNIERCIREERIKLGLLNLGEIQKCRENDELLLAQKKLKVLGLLESDLEILLSRCILLDELNINRIESCIDSELLRIDYSIPSIKTEMKLLLDNSILIGNRCISIRKNILNKLLVDIAKDLKNCVDLILES